MISMPEILAAGSATLVVPVKFNVSVPVPPISTSLTFNVVTSALNVSLAVAPVKVSVLVVSGRIVTLKKVNQISSL